MMLGKMCIKIIAETPKNISSSFMTGGADGESGSGRAGDGLRYQVIWCQPAPPTPSLLR